MALSRILSVGFLATIVGVGCGSDDEKSSGGAGAGGSGGSGGAGAAGGGTTSTGGGGATSTGGTGGTGGTTGGSGGAAGAGGTATGGAGGTAGGSGGTAGAGGMAPEAGAPVSVSYVVVEFARAVGAESGLEGVEVCVVDDNLDPVDSTNLCTTTAADGTFTLDGLTPGERILLQYSRDGYVGGLNAVVVGQADMTPGGAFRMAPLPADGGTVNNPGWDPAVTVDTSTKGSFNVVTVRATSDDAGGGDTGNGFDWVQGASFSITPDVGDGPFYNDANEDFVNGATETSGGWGAWFVNLDPGTYTVSVSHDTLNCNPAGGIYGWANDDGTLDAPVYAGQNTQTVLFFCAPPAP